MKTLLSVLILLLTAPTLCNAQTMLEEYNKQKSGKNFDKYKESIEQFGGQRTKEEFEKIDKAQPGDSYRDSDKTQYIKRCGYANTSCTWERID